MTFVHVAQVENIKDAVVKMFNRTFNPKPLKTLIPIIPSVGVLYGLSFIPFYSKLSVSNPETFGERIIVGFIYLSIIWIGSMAIFFSTLLLVKTFNTLFPEVNK